MNDREKLDRLLDSALRGYSAAEPRPGLEQRVIASLRSAPEESRFGWLSWAAVAAACLAVVAAVLIAYRPSPQPGIANKVPQASVAAPPVAPVVSAETQQPRRTVRPRPRTVAARSPRAIPVQRPILSGPLSQEERALMAFVRVAPETAIAVAKQQSEPDRPATVSQVQVPRLEVQPVEVAPLEK